MHGAPICALSDDKSHPFFRLMGTAADGKTYGTRKEAEAAYRAWRLSGTDERERAAKQASTAAPALGSGHPRTITLTLPMPHSRTVPKYP